VDDLLDLKGEAHGQGGRVNRRKQRKTKRGLARRGKNEKKTVMQLRVGKKRRVKRGGVKGGIPFYG